jgi:hypothetical protein
MDLSNYRGVYVKSGAFYANAGASVPPTTEEIDVYLDALLAFTINTVYLEMLPNNITDYRGTISQLKLFPGDITTVYSDSITELDFLIPHFERKGFSVIIFFQQPAGRAAGADGVVGNVGLDDRLVESTTPLREYMKQSCVDASTIIADRYLSYSSVIGVSLWDEPTGMTADSARLWVWFNTFAACWPILWAANPNLLVALQVRSWGSRPNEDFGNALDRQFRGADFLWQYPLYYNQFETTVQGTTEVAETDVTYGDYDQYPSHVYDNLGKIFLVPHIYRPKGFTLPDVSTGTANGWPWPDDYDDQDDVSQAYDASYIAQELEPIIRTAKKTGVSVFVEAFGVQRWCAPDAGYKWIRDMRKLFKAQGWGYAFFAFSSTGQNNNLGLPEWDDYQEDVISQVVVDVTIDDGLSGSTPSWTGTSKRWQAMSDDLPSL